MRMCENPITKVLCDQVDWIIDNAHFFKVMDLEHARLLKINLRKAYLRHYYDMLYPSPGACIPQSLTTSQKRVF